MSKDMRYAAFISYAHADEIMAARLHKALETYHIPKALKTADRKVLSPIFRDTAELTAHHSLSEKIREAVDRSRFLIVLCSPAAKDSHWVNEEIRLFRRLHGEGAILCVLNEGTPQTSFPPALLEAGREPLAANLGTSRDSFRLGVTQLAASMLGVGLDQLIQRETKRRRNRLRLMTTGSLVFAALMGGMAWTAVNARDAAETSRTEAEKMVEFMLTDLKSDLEPVGKLHILDDVGTRVTGYYGAIPLSDMDDDRLARQARARHLLGQVAMDQGKMDRAQSEVEAAYQATEEVLRRNPSDADAIFAHAQSEYWKGMMHYYGKRYNAALPFMERYAELSDKLYRRNSDNLDWIMEKGWSVNNIASLQYRLKNYVAAEKYYLEAQKSFEIALKISPDTADIEIELANVFSGLARTAIPSNEKEKSLLYRQKQIAIYDAQLEREPDNYPVLYRKVQANARMVIDGLIDDNQNGFLTELNRTLEEYDSLLEHEPDNVRWKKNYNYYLETLLEKSSMEDSKFINANDIKKRLIKLNDL